MTKQKSLTREYNRLYGNLVELCRRVYAEEPYPKTTCASWFVDTLNTLLENDDLKNLLNEEDVKVIEEMATNVRKTEYIDNSHKKCLTGLIKQLKTIETNLVEESKDLKQL